MLKKIKYKKLKTIIKTILKSLISLLIKMQGKFKKNY